MCIPTILSRHCSGQQGNRQLSTVYAKIFNWSLVWATGQQGGFERLCQNFEFVIILGNRATCCSRMYISKFWSRHSPGQQGNKQILNVYAKFLNWSLVWATGQQAGFECVCQNVESVVSLGNRATCCYWICMPKCWIRLYQLLPAVAWCCQLFPDID